MAKIKSSKKVLIASLLVGVLVLGAVVSLILVLAAPQQNVKTNVKVSYVVDGVGAKVSAKYHIVNPTSGVVANSVSLSSEEDKEELEFKVSDDESDPAKTLNPETTDPVQLTSTTSMIVYEYAFTNTTTAPFMVLLSGEPSDVENMDISYRSTGSKLTNFVGNFEETSPKAQLVLNKDQTIYFYIGVRVSELNKGANYSGNIEWTITHVQDSALKTLTLNNGTAGTEELKYLPDVQLPHLSKVPSNGTKAFMGYKNAGGTLVYDENGNSLAVESAQTGVTYTAEWVEAYVISGTGELIGLTEEAQTMTTLNIPETVKTINSGVFNNTTTSAKTINIPSSVTTIGESAFEGNTVVENINIAEAPATAAYADEKLTTIGAKAFKGCSNIKELIIPEGVTTIDTGAFNGCSNITHLVIPSTVTAINGVILSGCSSIKKLELPVFDDLGKDYDDYPCPSVISSLYDYGSLVSADGEYAFYETDSSSLEEVIINGGTTIPGGFLGYGSGNSPELSKEKLTSITIPESVTKIGGGAFEICYNLTAVHTPSLEAWLNIDFVSSHSNPLMYAGNLYINGTLVTEIEIPSTITKISRYVFEGFSGLIYNEYDNAKYLGNSENPYFALIEAKNSSITSCEINENTKVIASEAFLFCNKLTSLTIPSSVTSIGNSAFSYCNRLTYNEYDNARYLGNSENPYFALIGVKSTNITSCEINENTKVIVNDVFKSCYRLVQVRNLSGKALGDYTALSFTEIKTDNSEFSSTIEIGEKYAIFTNGSEKVLLYATDKTITSANDLPSDLTKIHQYAFSDCTNLTSVTIPSSVTSIGSSAFSGCSSLTSITIPSSVTSIGNSAFSYCESLTSITIPSSVTSIGNEVFYCCSSLTSITIPSSVISIRAMAFHDSSLTSINYSGTKAQWRNIYIGDWGFDFDYVEIVVKCTDGDITI